MRERVEIEGRDAGLGCVDDDEGDDPDEHHRRSDEGVDEELRRGVPAAGS